jgi:hypothetical protein
MSSSVASGSLRQIARKRAPIAMSGIRCPNLLLVQG